MTSHLYPKTKYGQCCVVPGCSFRPRTNLLSTVKSFNFPKDDDRRSAWVQAIRREGWKPGPRSVICSRHFVEGKPSKERDHPDWLPSVFPFKKCEEVQSQQKLSRFNRLQQRRKNITSTTPISKEITTEEIGNSEVAEDIVPDVKTSEIGTTTDFLGCHYDEMKKNITMLQKKVSFLEKQVTQVNRNSKGLSLLNENLRHSLLSSSSEEKILKDDDSLQFHTSLQNTKLFWTLFNFLMSVWTPTIQTSIEYHQQFLLVLMRFRLGLLLQDLGNRFSVPTSTVSQIIHDWLSAMSKSFKHFVKWPSKKCVRRNLPDCFKEDLLHNVRGIIDCSEIFIEKPTNFSARAETYSQYKSHNTVKFLVVCTPAGAISFISTAWGGRVSDKQLTKECGLMDLVEPGDVYLVDRGFQCDEMFAAKSATILMPAFTKGKSQLDGGEVTMSRKLSRVRIHVERIIGRLKNFRIFPSTLSISSIKRSDDQESCSLDNMLIVCAALTNLQRPIITKK